MDIQKIEELIQVLQGSRTEELSLRQGDSTVCIRKGRKPKPVNSSKAVLTKSTRISADEYISTEKIISAPMVGLFHANGEALKLGATIFAGQTVGTIESMKLLNDVIADVTGEITEVFVENGTPVEYAQLLCKINPA